MEMGKSINERIKDVKVGDIYEDMDRRGVGRRIRVENLTYDGTTAQVVTIASGRKTEISLRRLVSNDYRQVKVAKPKQAEG